MADFTFEALTPTSFLRRSAIVYGELPAIVDGERRFTYAAFYDRSLALAGLLAGGYRVEAGDRVAALCVNSHVMLELHNGVLLAGAALVPLNVRLSAPELVSIVGHSGARVLVATHELEELAAVVGRELRMPVLVGGEPDDAYEQALAGAEPLEVACEDERSLLGISYTSGTTAKPKGVMYHHRGAYLQALAMAYHTNLDVSSRYLWTLPMFHCHGWCFTWAVTAAGGCHICLRQVDASEIWELIAAEGVSHLSAAPTVLRMITEEARKGDRSAPQRIAVQTGGAPPSPALLSALAGLGFDVTHLYGLTETYGPLAINTWQPRWDSVDPEQRDLLNARQGVGNVIAARLRVVDAEGRDVPRDGVSIGEIVCRGNDVMLGYYHDEEATRAATVDGWFRTGDLAVMHPDHYVEIVDRSKDIIISGGENIASVELERLLESHPAIVEAAVVAAPDEKWGEVPVAFVVAREGAAAPAPSELVEFMRERTAHFKVPRRIEVVPALPKTSTGKIEKAVLRRQVSGHPGVA